MFDSFLLEGSGPAAAAIIIIIFTLLKFFTWALTDGFSLESERHQPSSSLQDSSRYSGHFQ